MTFVTLQTQVAGAPVEMRLADWNISACERKSSNQAGDGVGIDLLTTAADGPDPFPFGQQIILRLGRISPPAANGLPVLKTTNWSGGVTSFVGWRVQNFATVSPHLEKFAYKFGGPWDFFLERLPFYKLFVTYDATLGKQVARYRSQVILGQSLNTLTGPNDTIPGTLGTNLMSISQQIIEIVQFCISRTAVKYGTPQFQFDSLTQDGDGNWELNPARAHIAIPDYVPGLGASAGDGETGNGLAPGQTTTPLLAPLDAVQDISCAEALRREMRWIGGVGSPVAWFDLTTFAEDGVTPLPTLKISTRDQLPSKTLPAFPAGNTSGAVSLSICRRDDLIPSAIHLMYRVATTVGGAAFTQVYDDIACASGSTNAATGLTDETLIDKAIDFGAPATTIDFEGASISGGGGAQPVTITCIDNPMGGPSSGYKYLFPSLLKFSSFSVSEISFTDPDTGADVSTAARAMTYILTDGGIQDWMISGETTGASMRARIEISYSGTLGSTGNIAAGTKSLFKDVTLCNIPSGTYTPPSSGGGVVPGEQIPWGLASYIYNIETIPQYQGSFTLQEQEVTDPCPMGNNLNFSGTKAEWAAMNACVQEIEYDLVAATTTWSFGPAQHLGAQDLVERMRVNRFPRFYFLIGGNLLNQ